MISQQILNSEFDLAKRVYVYYFDKMADFLSIGSDRYLKWYKDLCVLFYLIQAIESVYIEDDTMMIGSQEIDDDFFTYITSNVREFINDDMRDIVFASLDYEGNVNDYTNPSSPVTIVTYNNFIHDWKSAIVEVAVSDVTEVTLPFNLAVTDPESIRLTVNDSDPIFIASAEEEGYHIIGTTLYWHHYFNLKAGDNIYIQYLQITNL